MARKGSRSRNMGLFTRVLSPVRQAVGLADNVSRSAFNRSGKIVGNGVGLLENVARSLGNRSDRMVSGLMYGRNRKGTRRNRRNNRKTRRNRR